MYYNTFVLVTFDFVSAARKLYNIGLNVPYSTCINVIYSGFTSNVHAVLR